MTMRNKQRVNIHNNSVFYCHFCLNFIYSTSVAISCLFFSLKQEEPIDSGRLIDDGGGAAVRLCVCCYSMMGEDCCDVAVGGGADEQQQGEQLEEPSRSGRCLCEGRKGTQVAHRCLLIHSFID